MKTKALVIGAVAVVAAAATVGIQKKCVIRHYGVPSGICMRRVEGRLVDPAHMEPFAASEAVGDCEPSSCFFPAK